MTNKETKKKYHLTQKEYEALEKRIYDIGYKTGQKDLKNKFIDLLDLDNRYCKDVLFD